MSSLIAFYFIIEAGSVPEPRAGRLHLSWLTLRSPASPSECWDYRRSPHFRSFYMGSGDTNLGPYACVVSTLPAKPSPQLLVNLISHCFINLHCNQLVRNKHILMFLTLATRLLKQWTLRIWKSPRNHTLEEEEA